MTDKEWNDLNQDYIVCKAQIINNVEASLLYDLGNKEIVKILMRRINKYITDVLVEDCEKVER